MSLSGKTAVITGASAGIGAATARRLAQSGAKVLLVARRHDRLDALAREIGAGATALALDLAAPDAAQAMLNAALERLGRVDILVNNAGILRTSHVDSFDLAELEPLIAINYTAVVRASVLFARAMKAQGSGQIVNISSIGASLTAAGAGVYGGLKAALERFTDALRIELAGSGVRVGLVRRPAAHRAAPPCPSPATPRPVAPPPQPRRPSFPLPCAASQPPVPPALRAGGAVRRG